jgi:DNA polymerase III subunit delta'
MKYQWPIIGHVKQLEELEKDLTEDRLSHAYLFAGPNQIGKMPVIRTFAQILQCENNFCRECHTCKQVEKGQHIDTFFLRDEGESLKIEDMRELISHLSTTKSSPYKIVVIQNIERITTEAANAFLKTLEEPTPGTIFLMSTTAKQRLLATLLSRVRVVSLHALSDTVIRDYLREIRPNLDPKMSNQIAAFAMGQPGRAMVFLNDPDSFRFYQDMYHQIAKFLERSSKTDRMMYVEGLVKDPEKIKPFLELFVYVVRNSIFKKIEGGQVSFSYEKLFDLIQRLDQARFELDHNVNQRLTLENLLLGV